MINLIINALLTGAKKSNAKLENIYVFRDWIVAKSTHYGMCDYIRGMQDFLSKEQLLFFTDIYNSLNRPVIDILPKLLSSENPAEIATGWACLSSALPEPDNKEILPVNSIAPFAILAKNMTTSFIGHFYEAEKWRTKGYPVNIIEFSPQEGDIHWNYSINILKKSELVFITGLTLLNGTFFEAIKRTSNAKIRVLLGAAVPLSPIFFNYDIHVVGSTSIPNIRVMLPYCIRGGANSSSPNAALQKCNITCLNEIKSLYWNYKDTEKTY